MSRFDPRAVALLFLLGAGGIACATLDPIPVGECGNGIVEKDSGEDCDDPDETKCGASTGASPCRYLCSDGAACKDGWRCGIDGVCSEMAKPFGWDAPKLVPEGTATTIQIADFDGDGRGDVMAVVPPSVNVHYFEADGTSTAMSSFVAPDGRPAVGVLSDPDTKVNDIAIGISGGLGVFRGSDDRTLVPAVYATGGFPSLYKIAPVRFTKLTSVTTTALAYSSAGVALVTGVKQLNPVALYGGDELVGELLVRRLFVAEGQFCDQFAAAFSNKGGGDYVWIHSPCDAIGDIRPAATNPGTKLSLPQGRKLCTDPKSHSVCRPLFAADVDHDGRTDLLIVSQNLQGFEVLVAYNAGNGHWSSTSGGVEDDLASLYAAYKAPDGKPVEGPPLAVGDLNDDCVLDYVNDFGIHTSTGGSVPPCTQVLLPTGYVKPNDLDAEHAWTDAAIADLNHDGLPDVVVGSDESAGITFFMGTGQTAFNPFTLSTSSGVRNFTVGDFDGDLLPDLAFAQTGEVDPETHEIRDSLAVMFGGIAGGPSQPVQMAEIGPIKQILSTSEHSILNDEMSDLFVVTAASPDVNDVSVFAGSSDRLLVAPYYLIDTAPMSSPIPHRPIRTLVAELDGNGHADIALLGRICDKDECKASSLWRLGTTGDAAIAPVSGTFTVLDKPPFVGGRDALIANIGPGGPGLAGTDQVVLIAPDENQDVWVAILGATSDEDPFALAAGPKKIKDLKLSAPGGRIEGSAIAADVDGDGHDDLVIAGQSKTLAVLLWDAAKDALDLDAPIVLPLEGCSPHGMAPPGMDDDNLPVSVAAVRLGDGPAKSLVAIARDRSFLVTYTGGALVQECRMDITNGEAIASGDLNGDGIDDLVVASKGGLRVLLGKTAKRASQETP